MPSLPNNPLLSASLNADELDLVATGSWTAPQASVLEGLIEAIPTGSARVGAIRVNLAQVRELDTFGAWLLERFLRASRDGAREVSFVAIPDRFRGLFDAVASVHRTQQPVSKKGSTLAFRSGPTRPNDR